MYKGSHVSPRKKSGGPRRPLLLLVSLVLLLALAVGGTVAWLNTSTSPVENTMIPGNVPITINETFIGTTKSDVSVTNTGNIDAYIRVAIVANAVDAEGNVVAGDKPSYNINTAYWQELDGYYYYKGVVAPYDTEGSTTAALFTEPVTVNGELNILAESIQVLGGIDGKTASEYAWSAVYRDGSWSAVTA